MELRHIFVEGELPSHLSDLLKEFIQINESEIHAMSYYLHYKQTYLSLCILGKEGPLSLSLDFDVELKKLDAQNLSLRSDPLKRLFRQKDISTVIEIGTGSAKDSIHFLALGLSVMSFERHLAIYALSVDAKFRSIDPRVARLDLNLGQFKEGTLKNAWVYFDPMFEHDKNRTAKSPKSMQIFQQLILESDGFEIFSKILSEQPERLIVKRARKQKPFKKSNFTLEGKSICYDVYLGENLSSI